MTQPIEDLYPLTPMQQGMLFHTLYSPASGQYFEQLVCQLGGAVDAAALREAWRAVVARHATLRTAFVWEEVEEPLQVVLPEVELPWRAEDWRGLPPAEQARRREELLAADRRQVFDLGQAPCLRLALLQMDDGWHLVWSYHHLILDGWSVARVLSEVATLYAARLAGTPASALGEAPAYREFIAWLQAQQSDRPESAGHASDGAERFWRARLAGYGGPAALFGEPAEGASGLPAPQARHRRLSAAESERLRQWAAAHGLTLNTVVQGAWALLLSRRGQGADVVLGVTVAGRPPEVPGSLEMVGMFINTLPLRLAVTDEAPLVAWLREVQRRHGEVEERGTSSLADVQRWSGLPREVPLFETLLVFESFPVDPRLAQGGGLAITGFEARASEVHYPLSLVVHPGPELAFELRGAGGRFAATDLDRLLADLERLLAALSATPGAYLAELGGLAAHERQQLLVEAADTAAGDPGERAVHALFAERAAEQADATALVFDGEATSYGELARRARGLAAALRRQGVGPETPVAVLLPRSAELVVALLGILEAGGFYLPLDPAHPPARLAWMLADAGAGALVSAAGQDLSRLTALPAPVPVVDVATAASVAGPPAAVEPAGGARLAYVLYTSGSTGEPKGVAVPHAAIVRLLRGTDYVRLAPDDRVAQAANVAFDAATFEIWGALLAGAKLVGIRREVALDPRAFAAELAEQAVTTLFLTTALFQLLVREAPGAFAGLRHLLFGGETVDSGVVRRLLAESPPARLLHVYGPTESTTFATWRRVRAVPAEARTVPIGGPLANTTAYLCDRRGEPVPAGVPGELLLGGPGLARGYFRRPALTAARFVPAPPAAAMEAPGARLYRTGDRCRRRADGGLEFLGRADFQVKIRGFRVELGEIEARLAAHPAIAEAVVLARGEGAEKRLVAYLRPTPALAGMPPRAELDEHLREALPAYMVPAAYVALDAFPLTATGKLDRRALPAPREGHPEDDGLQELPQGPLEELVARIWGDVLGQDRPAGSRPGRHEDFFAAGGHSLLATQLVSRLRAATGAPLPLVALFEAPTPAGLAARLLAALREGEAAPPPLLPAATTQPAPLSFAQQRLWFLDELEPGSAAYHVAAVFALDGRLSPGAAAWALAEIRRRHQVLRSRFDWYRGEPAQFVEPWQPGAGTHGEGAQLPVIDLQGLHPAARAAEQARLLAREGARPFDLAAGDLLRNRLLRLAPERHVWALTLHHVVSDGWSMGVFVRELMALYAAHLAGEPSPLPELAIQYGDYSRWQRQWLVDEVLEAEVAHVRQRLAGAPAVLALPTDRPRPAQARHRGAVQTLPPLPPEIAGRIHELCRREGFTPFMVLLAAFQLLLARYVGETEDGKTDVVVGSPVANRHRVEIEPLIGFFVNTLVLRTEIPAAASGREVLERTRAAAVAAYAHQDLPFEKLVEELNPERDLAHSPLFQVSFALQSFPLDPIALPGLTLRPLPVPREAAQFDLAVALTEEAGSFVGTIEHDTDLFDATTVRRLGARYARLLAALVADPDQGWAALSWLSPSEEQQLREWNDSAAAYDLEASLDARIRRQAAATPDAVALVAEEGTLGDSALSYAALVARAERLAGRLRRLGAGRGTTVGIAVERGLELPVGLLAILGAGAAYVPLDPDYPAARLAAMMEDAGLTALLTQERLLARLPAAAPGLAVLTLDDLASEPTPAPVTPTPGPTAGPDDLAYVIFTSGSTGRAKGAMNRHRGIVNRLLWMQERYGLTAEDRVLQKTPTSFDVSVWELFWPLLAGARLVLAAPGGHRDSAYLARTIARQAVTTLHFVPSMLQAFLAEADLSALAEGDLAALRRVMASGEALPAELVARFFARLPAVALHNLYGPTEAAVDVTFFACRPGDERSAIPIGRPVANTRVRVVDRAGRELPADVPGELLLGGVQVGDGYRGRPATTAERFVPDPWSTAPGARLYRTGDRARFEADGNLAFLGRLDRQIKVRGFRVEPGEIEAALLRHPGIADSAVVARDGGPRGLELHAFFVPAAGLAPAVTELRLFLAERLPAFAVPARFFPLAALPKLPNGKLDRAGLPSAEDGGGSATAGAFQAPRSGVEAILAEIWAELLDAPRLGVHDNFFDLGGHSLLATQVVSRAQQVFRRELPMRTLFERPTIARLAEAIEAALATGTTLEVPPLAAVERGEQGELPLSFAQQRLWFLDRLDPSHALYSIPSLHHLEGDLDVAAFAGALAGVARRHEVLRTTYPAKLGSGEVMQRPGPVTLRLAHVDLAALPARAQEEHVERLLVALAGQPFDLARGPVQRVALVWLGPQRWVFCHNIHHIAFDGWSLGILLHELSELYRARREGRPPVLPHLAIQYGDYAVWQRRYLAGEVLGRELDYWRTTLAGAAPLELPLDRPRRPPRSFRGAMFRAPLPAASAAFRDLVKASGSSLFMGLLAAFAALLHRQSGQTDVLIGTPVSNRNHPGLEGLIGFFVNTLVLRVDLAGEPSARQLLERVREATLAAYTHQDLPFERLVEELQPERDPGRAPLVDVLFSVEQQGAQPELELPGVRARHASASIGTAKHDLTLALADQGGGLLASLEYSTELFDRTTVERLLARFGRLLAAVIAAPDRPLAALDLLAPAERQQLLAELNDTATGAAANGTDETEMGIAALFARQAEAAPERVALVAGGGATSYGELSRRAAVLARRLVADGIGAEDRVGVALERSAAAVTAFLAVLATGAAYVPVEPDQPESRLALLLGDARVRGVLGRAALGERIAGLGLPLLPLGDAGTAAAGPGLAAPGLETQGEGGDRLAYVIYTSGSTGTPKGVAVPARGIVRLVRRADYLQIVPGRRVAHLSNVAFDAATFEIWGALLNGATLVVLPPGVGSSPPELAALVAERAVDVLFLTTALFNQMSREAPPSGSRGFASGLDTLLFGGEAVDPERVRAVLDPVMLGPVALGHPGGGPRRLLHVYGPTENTTFSTWQLVRDVPAGASTVPIGSAIAGSTAYVVRHDGRPAALGLAGELLLGGAGLARGYLDRPAATAERFVPDPWSALPGARLYASGDLVRRTAQGGIEFLGRLDQQVKVRGFRVEPGEIESALARHPAVAVAVVVAWPAEDGTRRLAAYFVPRAGEEPAAEELRRFLKRSLPEPMLPASFQPLAFLPLTPNGKLDRRALPSPESRTAPGETAAATAWQAGRTPTEEVLAGLWAAVLGVEPESPEADFYELGGHSLQLTRVASQVRETFGVELPLRLLFEDPVLAAQARRIDEAVGAGLPATARPLVAAPGPEVLSFAQERLWFLDQLQPGSPFYNVPVAFRLRAGTPGELSGGEVSAAALATAFAHVVARHHALRTRVLAREGLPAPRLAPVAAFCLREVDLAGLPAGVAAVEEARQLQAGALRPFDLGREIPLRVVLLRRGAGEAVLLVVIHHIATDAWSMGILVRELAEAWRSGTAPAVAPVPLPLQYGDYARWQRGWLQGEALAAELDFWRGELAGAPPVLELPTDRPRPAVQSLRGAVLPLRFPPGLAERLRALARSERVTLFMVLFAGFTAFLARLTGLRDLVVGAPIANRRHRETEGLIGFFVNTLVLRVRPAGDPRFAELLAAVRATTLGAYAHQDLPFEKLVEGLAPRRDMAHSPIVQVLFSLQNAADLRLDLASLDLEPLAPGTHTAKLDLTFGIEEQGAALGGWIEYASDLFDAATVRRWAGHWLRLLASAVEAPASRLSELSLLAPWERQQVLAEVNDTARSPAAHALPLHEHFARQAAATPDAAALVTIPDPEQPAALPAVLSFAELARRSHQLAHALRRLGVAREAAVAVCLERSPEMVIAVLALLEAGGFCVPLDPAYPADRLSFMLADSGARILLGQAGLAPQLAAQVVAAGGQALDLLQEWPAIARESAEPLGLAGADEITGADLFYVIYTSGSTGQPKGIELQHEVMGNLLVWHWANLLQGARTLQYAPLSFDASFHELFAAWAGGGCLYLIPEALRRDVPALLQAVEEQRIEKVILPVVVLHQFGELHDAGKPAPRSLREVTTTGEQLKIVPGVVRLFEKLELPLHNHYGPSETHVVTAETLRGAPASWPSHPTIGRPIDNTDVIILDRGLRPVPFGVVGELYLGGLCLARGYRRRPRQTAERFLPDPFGAAGERLYKTGDLARWLPDGRCEFLGRADHQLKIRGFRVEPEEVEAALAAQPGLQGAVVVARDDLPGGRGLVAFVVARGEGATPTPAMLRAGLEQRLPAYMVPSLFVFLPELPLTPSGKIHRGSLAHHLLPRESGPGEAGTAPRTPAEQVVAAVWADVFGRDRVAVEDDFFALGGHSLLATRVLARLQKSFGTELPLRLLFERPRLGDLAQGIEDCRQGTLPAAAPILPLPRGGTFELSLPQTRLWLFDRLGQAQHIYNLGSAARLRGRLDAAALGAGFAAVARRHELLRGRFVVVDGEPRLAITAAVPRALPLVDLGGLPRGAREATAHRLASAFLEQPFKLSVGPPWRATLLRLESEEHALLLAVHHIVFDDSSWPILLGEVSAGYRAALAGVELTGAPAVLPPLPVQYADYAGWQRRAQADGRLDRQLDYWRRQLAGCPEDSGLPTDRPRPAQASYRGAVLPLLIDAGLAAALDDLARRQGVTLFTLLLAAFQVLLYRASGREDVVVGCAFANRDRLETERLIGFFLNTLVLRADLSGHPSFAELLARVQRLTLDAWTHRDVPFERVVEAVAPQRDPGRNPLFQVAFTLQHAPPAGFELPGITLEPQEVTSRITHFDLTLQLVKTERGIEGGLEYGTDLFAAATIARLAADYRELLAQVAARPEARLIDLPLFASATAEPLAAARFAGEEFAFDVG